MQALPTFKLDPKTMKADKVANGKSIRKLREHHMIAGWDLAEKLGVSGTYLSEMERGNRCFSFQMFNRAIEAIKDFRKPVCTNTPK